MTNLITNETNLDKLRENFSNAKKEILLCSAWITSSTLRRVLTRTVQKRIQAGELTLRVLIRLGDPMDVKITDPGVFKLIEELGTNASLRYHRRLHAKMFAVDEAWAMVGSFNLTGGGFGDAERPGSNPETGFEFTARNAVHEVRDRFEEIWNDSDVKEIDQNLLGFVLSPSADREFWMIGIQDLPMNKFVQTPISEDEIIIGKINHSEKHDFNYFNADISTTEFGKRFELMDAFGKEDLGGMAKAMATQPGDQQILKVALVKITNKVTLKEGQLNAGGLTFSSIPPDVAAPVYRAEKGLLEMIFNYEGFAPANLFENREIEVGFDLEELTTKHFSVFGSTGSGKSYFVKRLLSNELYEWYCKKHKGRIIIFDPHNEYREGKDMPAEFVNNKRKFETIDATKYMARLISDIEDLEEALNLNFNKREEKNAVEKILNSSVRNKLSNLDFIIGLKAEALQVAARPDIDIEAESSVLAAEVDDAFYQYLSELKDLASKIADHEIATGTQDSKSLVDEYGGSTGEAKSRYIHEKVKELYSKLSLELQQTLKEQVIHTNVNRKIEKYFESDIRVIADEIIETIENALISGDITIEQLDFVKKMNKPKIYRINLVGIHEEDIRHKLTASILAQVFNAKKDAPEMMDTVFVIEEAHNFAPEGGGRNNPAARIIKKIAAEGRKFNLGLIVITQRPAYVSKDVLAQCSTQAIFRLINNRDLDAIKEVVEGVSEAEVNLLPHFETGQAIFSGVGIRQPVIVKGKEI